MQHSSLVKVHGFLVNLCIRTLHGHSEGSSTGALHPQACKKPTGAIQDPCLVQPASHCLHSSPVVHFLLSQDCLQQRFYPWNTLVSTSVKILGFPMPHGPKIFLRRRYAALRRSAPSAWRVALVQRSHNSSLWARRAQRTPPERAARDESGRAPPSRPERRS
jgi:hypothetical protein